MFADNSGSRNLAKRRTSRQKVLEDMIDGGLSLSFVRPVWKNGKKASRWQSGRIRSLRMRLKLFKKGDSKKR